MSEAAIQQDIRLALGKCPAVRTFRNNCGNVKTPEGRWVKFGVGNPGGADLIGWQTVTITPDMVGQRFARFLSVEVKAPKGRLTPEQETWRQAVLKAGGIAVVARSVDDVNFLIA
tara:strand:- start:558 stop:902 length:345 start_codon:yes stop_codon:yes gene_type:complete